MESDRPPEFEITPVDAGIVKEVVLSGLHKVAQAARFVFSMPHELSTHGDHFVPFEEPVEPVTSLPEPVIDLTDNVHLGED